MAALSIQPRVLSQLFLYTRPLSARQYRSALKGLSFRQRRAPQWTNQTNWQLNCVSNLEQSPLQTGSHPEGYGTLPRGNQVAIDLSLNSRKRIVSSVRLKVAIVTCLKVFSEK